MGRRLRPYAEGHGNAAKGRYHHSALLLTGDATLHLDREALQTYRVPLITCIRLKEFA